MTVKQPLKIWVKVLHESSHKNWITSLKTQSCHDINFVVARWHRRLSSWQCPVPPAASMTTVGLTGVPYPYHGICCMSFFMEHCKLVLSPPQGLSIILQIPMIWYNFEHLNRLSVEKSLISLGSDQNITTFWMSPNWPWRRAMWVYPALVPGHIRVQIIIW